MTLSVRWQYLTAEVNGGMMTIPGGEAAEHRQSLRGGLDHLGSQGWELVSALPLHKWSAGASFTLILKRPSST